LFDKSIPPPPAPLPVHVNIQREQKSKLKKALSRAGSLDKIPSKKPDPFQRGKGSAKRAVIVGGKSRASRAGLVFPIGRLKRKLKEIMVGQRVGVGSAVYMAAVLEYMTAELLEVAGNVVKTEKKKRISPLSIKNALKNDL